MAKLTMATLLVLLVIYVVPFAVYGGASVIGGLQPPSAASPGSFLLGVLITNGTAIAFVSIFAATKTFSGPRWLLYAVVWFVMFVLSELVEVVWGRTTVVEAVLGVVSGAIYTPLSAFIARWLLGRGAV